jgi:ribosomal-protein-alanine N-acetyltransferase
MLVFRKMKFEDVSVVHNLECQLFSDPWPKKVFLHDVQNEDTSQPYVVERNGEIIGYIICWYYAKELHIGNMAVAPHFQNRGIGKYLLENLFKQFPDYEITFLEVRETNQSAINLYKKYGFKLIYRRQKYYSNGEDALVLAKYQDNENVRNKNGLV